MDNRVSFLDMLNLRFAIRGEVTGASQEILILHRYQPKLSIFELSAMAIHPGYGEIPYLRAIKI
jgi:hypothetical protein